MRFILLWFVIAITTIAKGQTDYFGMVQVDTNLWVDQTEITNNEYRQFVNWVKDSIARKILFDAGLKEYETTSLLDNTFRPNLKKNINYHDSLVTDILKKSDVFFLNAQERFYDKDEINTGNLNYTYNNNLGQKMTVNVYPDTSKMLFYKNFKGDTILNCDFWVQSSYCRLSSLYFFHPAYGNYPAVNITYEQAMAFCFWRTNLLNDRNHHTKADLPRVRVTLPTLEQWNYISDHSKLSLALYNKRPKKDSTLAIQEYFSKLKTVYYGGNQSVDFRYIINAPDEDLKRFSKLIKSYYRHCFKYLKENKRNLTVPHCIVSLDTHPFEQNDAYFDEGYTLLPVEVGNQFGFTSEFVSKKKKRIFGFAGNVAEMTLEGNVIGGSFHHPLDYCKRGKTIEQDANKPERWLGFRCVLVHLPEK